jgi:hypothetical protein
MSKAFDPGVPLADYRKLGASVDLTCARCIHRRVLGLEAVITRLSVRGLSGDHTGIRDVARFVRDPCPRCGGREFESRPYFPQRLAEVDPVTSAPAGSNCSPPEPCRDGCGKLTRFG